MGLTLNLAHTERARAVQYLSNAVSFGDDAAANGSNNVIGETISCDLTATVMRQTDIKHRRCITNAAGTRLRFRGY